MTCALDWMGQFVTSLTSTGLISRLVKASCIWLSNSGEIFTG